MAKIKKVSSVKNIDQTKKTNSHFVLQSKLFNSSKVDKKLSRHREVKVALTIDEMIREVKSLSNLLKGGITLKNIFDYSDNERVKRASTQLKIFFLKTFSRKDGDIFKFIAKSSGLHKREYYQVEVQFTDIEDMIDDKNAAPKDMLMNSRIRTQCSCEDFTYRFRYYLTKLDAVLGLKEHRFPKITNANREHKFLCKHQILVLNGMRKQAFLNTFTRYINNKRDGRTIRVNKKDIASSYISSSKIKIDKNAKV